jgi:hypothetical protein
MLMDFQQISFGHQPFANTPLVTYDDNLSKFFTELLNGFFNAIIKPEFLHI